MCVHWVPFPDMRISPLYTLLQESSDYLCQQQVNGVNIIAAKTSHPSFDPECGCDRFNVRIECCGKNIECMSLCEVQLAVCQKKLTSIHMYRPNSLWSIWLAVSSWSHTSCVAGEHLHNRTSGIRWLGYQGQNVSIQIHNEITRTFHRKFELTDQISAMVRWP